VEAIDWGPSLALRVLHGVSHHLYFVKQKGEFPMVVQDSTRRNITFLALLTMMVGLVSSLASAQYTVTNLTSNQAGKANHQDTDLVNPWGVAYAPGGPFWMSDEGTGKSTLYNAQGVKQGLVVTIPGANGGIGSPTGQVYNSTTDFVITQNGHSAPATFIFDTFDGTISGWNGGVNGTSAVIAATKPGAWYTGLALASSGGKNFLYAADNLGGTVDMYDATFHLVKSFTDPNLPPGWVPYNVHSLLGKLVVTFVDFSENGVVDVFDTSGKFLKTITTSPKLRSPWGIALAPSNFGPASGALLIGNEDDGRINAFNAKTGKFLASSGPIAFPGLWELIFGGGSANNGKTNQLFVVSGPDEYVNGLFSVIDVQ
jgi:uncharacterized protein (TIGR03118 family)